MLTRRSFFAFRQFKSNIHQKHDYKQQCRRDLNICTDIPKITHFSSSFSNKTVTNKNIIPKATELINCKICTMLRGNNTFEPIRALPNQPAERLMDNPEKALSQARLLLFTENIVSSFGKKGFIYE